MLKIIIALTLISQSYANLNIFPEDSLSDVFPLEIDKVWFYSFSNRYSAYPHLSEVDTDFVEYRIMDSISSSDSTIWYFKQRRSYIQNRRGLGWEELLLVNDSSFFEMIELHMDRHYLYTPVLDKSSAFPFARIDDDSRKFFKYVATNDYGYKILDLFIYEPQDHYPSHVTYYLSSDTGIVSTHLASGSSTWSIATSYILQSQMDTLILASKDFDTSPLKYWLNQNYPNPFNPTTKISYQIPKMSFTQMKVYDVLGKEIAIVVNEEKPAGNYEVEFRADELQLSSGIYFYRLQTGDFVETKKMILLR